jgi:hypothetical protein
LQQLRGKLCFHYTRCCCTTGGRRVITDLTEVRLLPAARLCVLANCCERCAQLTKELRSPALFWRGDLHLVERRRDLQKSGEKMRRYLRS